MAILFFFHIFKFYIIQDNFAPISSLFPLVCAYWLIKNEVMWTLGPAHLYSYT